jgi:8-amino-7-oxononanoate synthase
MFGAYASGSRLLIRWLVNRARTLTYSTALPPSVVAGIREALRLVRSEDLRRESLAEASRIFRTRLLSEGIILGGGDSESPIVPIILGDSALAMQFSESLEREGILAVAIRPPTVPDGTSRLRCSLSAAHPAEDLERAVEVIVRTGKDLGVLNR